MATAKNVFIKSKMNKDLDDRLLGKGEYREALNVNISKSEASDVGALENVLGNKLLTNLGLSDDTLEIIGYFADDFTDNIYFFITNYCDTSSSGLSNFAPFGSTHLIMSYNINTLAINTLAAGRFLNFSTTNRVENVDVIESLLFWTDNRNQPRKLNINKALSDSSFYNNEDKISVTKYYPYSVPKVYKSFTIDNASSTTTAATNFHVAGGTLVVPTTAMLKPGYYINFSGVNSNGAFQTGVIRIKQIYNSTAAIITSNVADDVSFTNRKITVYYPTSADKTSEFVSPSIYARLNTLPNAVVDCGFIQIKDFDMPPYPGMQILNPNFPKGTTVTSINTTTSPITVQFSPTLDNSPQRFRQSDQLAFSDPNPEYDNNFPGDKLALEDKFIRLAYRFRFNDNEYSLISPFTQPIFIPKQDGYMSSSFQFVSDIIPGVNPTDDSQTRLLSQENEILNSTIISWFENKVNQTQLQIDTPVAVNQLANELDVKQIDIIYKESDGLAFRLLETVETTDERIANNSTTTLEYTYQGKKPVRTLTEAETVRVFDKSPVRAQTQSVTGNRVIYGNFMDKATPPSELDFYVGVSPKYNTFDNYSSFSTVAYPNHTLKQNRTYQVGIVLADKYGRQSDVIVSKFKSQTIEFPISSGNFFGGSTVYTGYLDEDVNVKSWFGNSIKLLWESAIPENINTPGYPGLYKSGKYTVTVADNITGQNQIELDEIPLEVKVGDILIAFPNGNTTFCSIKDIDYANKIVTIDKNLTLTNGQGCVIYGESNPLGWYSYKVVVKQLAQPYYNLYLPPALAGDPTEPTLIQMAFIPQVNTIANAQDGTYQEAKYTYEGTTGSGAEFTISVFAGVVTVLTISASGVGYKPGDKFIFDTDQFGTTANPATGELELRLTEFMFSEDPAPNESTTSYITLLSDNINKLPPDLTDVTPEQTQFRTSDDLLFPRVAGKFPGGNQGPATQITSSVQYYLDDESFNVGNYAKLDAMGIATATTPSLIAKGIFKATSNPTVAELVTTGEGYGQRSDSVTFPFIINNQSPPASVKFGLPLAVLEVKPPMSSIDIYYETSTTGLISDLNKSINDATINDTPFEIKINKTPPNQGQSYNFNESRNSALSQVIFGPLYAYNAAGGLLSNATMTLSSVLDLAGNNVTNEFSLIPDTNGYSLLCSDNKFYGSNAAIRNWTYNVLVENVSAGITYSNTLSFTGGLSNTNPSFNNIPINQVTSFPNGTVEPATGGSTAYIEAMNGSFGQFEKQQEITWSVTAVIGSTDYSSNFSFQFGSSGLINGQALANRNRLTYSNLTVIGTYTVTITITDGGNATDSHTFTLQRVSEQQSGDTSG